MLKELYSYFTDVLLGYKISGEQTYWGENPVM
jgi:hypothetical protein